MLIEEKRNRMARTIIKLVHECDAGMRQGVVYYRAELAKQNPDPAHALELLKRAARLPYRVEARVQVLVSKYGAAAVNQALAQVSALTLADLQAELNPLKTYSDTLKNNYQNLGWTEEQVAADIEATRPVIDKDEQVADFGGYVDDM